VHDLDIEPTEGIRNTCTHIKPFIQWYTCHYRVNSH